MDRVAAIRALVRDCRAAGRVDAMLKDLNGEIRLSCDREQYVRWGEHYLRMMWHAYDKQICVNFKEPGIQEWGGEQFRRYQEIGDEAFGRLPAPVPRISALPSRGGGGAPVHRAPVDMRRQYHDRSNPCFTEDSTVECALRGRVEVRDIRAGDCVRTSEGSFSPVECVVVTRCDAREMLIRVSNGLTITPYHPVRVNDRVAWPCALAGARRVWLPPGTRIVSILMKHRSPFVVVGNIATLTLAHGIQGCPVASHAFLGTEHVVDALRVCPGWDIGMVVLPAGAMRRNVSTGTIDAIDVRKEGSAVGA